MRDYRASLPQFGESLPPGSEVAMAGICRCTVCGGVTARVASRRSHRHAHARRHPPKQKRHGANSVALDSCRQREGAASARRTRLRRKKTKGATA
jgi:hypothetical protein